MSGADWLSYSLQDFVMFGPQVFLRLFVRINQELWPWQLLAVVLAIGLPALFLKRDLRSRRLAVGLIAVAWAGSGYGFLVGFFGPINWPAVWFGWAFVGQGALLATAALFGGVHGKTLPVKPFAVLWLMVVCGLPWLSVVESGQWQAVALFGIAPGITAAAGALVFALITAPWRWLYLPLLVLWGLFSAALFWVLQTWWLLVTPGATLLLVGAGFWLSPRREQNQD
ncbi:DUF6064 family protein [Marinobacter sp.]|uniref:DUF6064 family protein n=1 Tax=Marinobacter sp. TaxID=50741 RepID=UPI003561DFDC